ncbi:uncharacterized protein LOC116827320 isoform X1 [Chelonoidis abingdonii]|uniref:uncharacterized protein LOC116827320 isoform X1 n=1 Tax=Chelonoidis abingdonii TaxID=106734 RepID=UPI0013F28910|nr:uncharacterized protein LOC116827320 isoform X1 [Chelonoidis abingdonii]
MDIDALSSPWDSSRSSSCDEEPYGELAVSELLAGATKSLCSQEEEGCKKQQSHQGKGAGVPQQDDSWMNIAYTHSQVCRASAEGESHLQAPRKKMESRRVDQKNPPFEDFKGTLIDQDPKGAKSHQRSVKNQRAFVYQPSSTEHAQGDPPPLAKLAIAPAEKREQCDSSEAPSEIKSPRRMQPLAKSTQTEESSPDQTQPPCFPDGRGNKNSFGLEKRNSPPPLGGAGRKWAEGSEVECEEELKELGWINYGFTTEPVYKKLDCPVEEGVKVKTVTDVSYKDDHRMYCFDYGNRHYYQPKKDHERAYMMKLAESSEKVIQQNLREFFGLLRILVNVVFIFLVELVRFLGKSVFQVFMVGLLTTAGDHVLKPFLVAVFNSLLQPLLLFLLNVLCSVRNLTYPLIDILKGICLQLAVVLQAFRLVEVNIQSETPLAQKV